MRYIKMLALAAVATAALTALVGVSSASAANKGILCSATENPCSAANKWATGTVLDFSVPAGGSVKLTNLAGSVTFTTCSTATVKGTLNSNPDASGFATGTNSEITWGTAATRCTAPATEPVTITLGKLKIENETGTSNGLVFADAPIEVTLPGLFGEGCIYRVIAGQKIGTLTEGKAGTATPPVFTAEAEPTKVATAEHPCFTGPGTAKWTGSYNLTSPSGTTLSVSSS